MISLLTFIVFVNILVIVNFLVAVNFNVSMTQCHGQSDFKISFRQLRRDSFVTKPIYYEQHNRFVAETGLNRSKSWTKVFPIFWNIEDSLSF